MATYPLIQLEDGGYAYDPRDERAIAKRAQQTASKIAKLEARIAGERGAEHSPESITEWQGRLATLRGVPTTGGAPQSGPYDAFQKEALRLLGRTLTQQELDNGPFLETLSNELIRLLPAGRLDGFSSARLMQLDNADLFALVMHNPHIANAIPGWRLTQGNQLPDGSYSGGLSGEQMQQILGAAQSKGIGGNGINELAQTYQKLGGAPVGTAPAATPGTADPVETLAREMWQAELANQPGNVYNWLFKSRGMEPGQASTLPDLAEAKAGAGEPISVWDGTRWVPRTQPGNAAPVVQQGAVSTPPGMNKNIRAGIGIGPPLGSVDAGVASQGYTSAGQQITDQPRPSFEQLRQQVQAVGADIPPGVLNPILGQPTPSYTAQGGMPLLAAQTAARMSPAERAVWDVTVNRTGGRAEDDDYMARRLGRTGGGVSVAYTGASRTPGARR